MNWPAFAFRAMKGASIDIRVTEGFSSFLRTILYMFLIRPFQKFFIANGQFSAHRHYYKGFVHICQIYIDIFVTISYDFFLESYFLYIFSEQKSYVNLYAFRIKNQEPERSFPAPCSYEILNLKAHIPTGW